MKRLVFSSVFEADFADLTALFATEASPDVSRRWERAVIRVVNQLQKFPEMGRLRRDLYPRGIRTFGVREFPNFLLFYRMAGNEITFLRVRFGGMDLTKLFPDD